MPLSKLRILVKDGDAYFKYANVDWLDGGQGLLIYDYLTGEKISRHPNQTFERVGGAGSHNPPSTSIPFSDIRHQVIRQVSISSDATHQLPRYYGDPSNAFCYSSTALSSRATFAAELVHDSLVAPTIDAYTQHPD